MNNIGIADTNNKKKNEIRIFKEKQALRKLLKHKENVCHKSVKQKCLDVKRN